MWVNTIQMSSSCINSSNNQRWTHMTLVPGKTRHTSLQNPAFSHSECRLWKNPAWICVDVHEQRNRWETMDLGDVKIKIWLTWDHEWFWVYILCYPHLNSICFSCRVTMATRGGRPVLRVWSSTLDAMICVVISASAATPAPQQLENIQEFIKYNNFYI